MIAAEGAGAELSPAKADAALHLDLDGWEGPLDLLLDLARRQKVDLRHISILALVDQYLAYMADARALRLELAADYLVMAAWLAYLKSALLLPPAEQPEEPSPEELALRLRLRLARLAAMREAAARLLARDQLGQEVFMRGRREAERDAMAVDVPPHWHCDLYSLLTAYGAVTRRRAPVLHVVRARAVMTLEAALARITAMLGQSPVWHDLAEFLPDADAKDGATPGLRRSALAASFAASLELARRGAIEIDQAASFAPLRLRAVAHR